MDTTAAGTPTGLLIGGVLAVYRVLPISKTLKRLKRWPKEVE